MTPETFVMLLIAVPALVFVWALAVAAAFIAAGGRAAGQGCLAQMVGRRG